MALPVVVALAPAPAEAFSPLQSLAEVVTPPGPVHFSAEDLVREQSRRPVSGLILPGEFLLTADVLAALPDLRVVANTAAGYNNLPLDELARRGIWATNTPDAFTDATADAAMGLLLALARKLAAGDAYVRTGKWATDGPQPDRWSGMELAGKTMGLVGFGRIGQAVARRAVAFGMHVIHHRRQPSTDPRQRSLEDLLGEADVIVLLVPLTEASRHLIRRDTLALVRPGTLLVNIARGPVADEEAVVEALRSGRLGGAALDVFEREPQVHPALRELPNVVLTPHLGGATREARLRARITASANVAAVLRGERPPDARNEPVR
jgi:glyoxylate reductase